MAFRDVVVVWTEAHAKVLAEARAAGAALAEAQAAVQAAGAALTVSISESGCVVASCEASSIEPSSVLVPAMGATLPLACAWSVIICGRQHRSAFSSADQRQHACFHAAGSGGGCNGAGGGRPFARAPGSAGSSACGSRGAGSGEGSGGCAGGSVSFRDVVAA